MPNLNSQKSIKNIEVGKFYLIHDGSRTGHPGLVVWKNDEVNLYLVIRFGTSKNNKNTPINCALSKNVKTHYVYINPLLAKRKDIGFEWVFDYKINAIDNQKINEIIYRFPKYSKSINRKDRRYFSLVIKQKQIKTVH